MSIKRNYPGVADFEARAKRRIPAFAHDYMVGGIGREMGLARNVAALDRVQMTARYLSDAADKPDTSCEILGQRFSAPFGVAPVGLNGLMWPDAGKHLCRAARARDLPFTLSVVATAELEEIAEIGGPNAWFQHYPSNRKDVNEALIARARDAGFEVLFVTVDIPTFTRRDRDIRNGLSVPPRMDARNLMQIAMRPRWALETLRKGLPRFHNLTPYIPAGADMAETGIFLTELLDGHCTLDDLKWYRDNWPGKMVVKGLLDPGEAVACQKIGADAVVVSNHGARQLDAAPATVDLLAPMRAAVGPDFPLIVDGGVRSGLDVARMMAKGADFVLMGRAFMFAMAALGEAGADHAMEVLTLELKAAMGQIGAPAIADLPAFLVD